MIETRYCSSLEECSKLIPEGFVVVAISGFESAGGWSYTLERGSEWSRFLGSR